mmetsp:Transcript_31457/g.55367  ORF Transcript_31457/g.55367 Transcript_31457/m.55367 type:complete len:214 (-) Transcript_31457:233-874(-)
MDLLVIAEKEIFVFRIRVKEHLEGRVLVQSFVGRHPKEIFSVFFAQEIRVVESQPVLRPRFSTSHSDPFLCIVTSTVERASEFCRSRFSVAVFHNPTPLLEGTADSVRAREGHDVAIVEPHTVKHVAKVPGRRSSAISKRREGVGQISLLWTFLLSFGVLATVAHMDLRAPSVLDCCGTAKLNKICPRNDRILGFNLFQVSDCLDEACVCTMA